MKVRSLMNIKTTLALLVILAAGGVLAWFGPALPHRQPAPEVATTDAGSKAILEQLRPDQLRRIEIRQGDRVTVLERPEGGEWSLPGGWPVRKAEVEALVDLLGNLRSRFASESISQGPKYV